MCTRIIEETWTVLELATTVTEAQPAASKIQILISQLMIIPRESLHQKSKKLCKNNQL